MRLQFVQAVHLKQAPGHPAKDYKVGVHEVPTPVLKANHATIEKYIKAGWIIEGEAIKTVVSLESPKERQLRLAERLGIDVSKEKAAIAAASKKDEAPPVEEDDDSSQEASEPSEFEEESEDGESEESSENEEAPSDDEVETPKKSKKKRK
jgi:hypothetical protein